MNNSNGDQFQPMSGRISGSKPLSAANHSGLHHYLSELSIDALLAKPDTLMVLPYATGSRRSCAPSKPGVIHSGLSLLGAESSYNEVWTSNGESVDRGLSGNCYWSKTNSLISVAIWLSPEQCQHIEESTFIAYSQLLRLIQDQGYPHPFRFWNYIPDITLGRGDDEHYKLFCSGRLRAFKDLGYTDEQFPSASALGHHSEGAVIYLLAAKKVGQHHNNALQVNAYQYPREYGISSPSFSRATHITINKQDMFFVSGTASIIGHKSTHEGDLKGQLQTTISNIEHLLKNKKEAQLKSLKVYLRHASDYIIAKQYLDNAFPNSLQIVTLADICRANLLVEVECFCG